MSRRITGRAAIAKVVIALAAATSGCASDGLSVRESTHQYAATMYPPRQDAPERVPSTGATPVRNDVSIGGPIRVVPPVTVSGPISVAVVQLGEVSPPDAAIAAFEARPDLFERVDPLAGHGAATVLPTADDLTAYRQAAANLGDDFVLVYGGTIDRRRANTPLSLLDATVVGMFVVPSRALTLTGRAAGSMVDVRTGRVAFSVTADDQETTMHPFTMMAGAEGGLTDGVRRHLEEKLVARTTERLAGLRRVRVGV